MLNRIGETAYAASRSHFDYSDIESIRDYFKDKEIDHVIHLAGAVEKRTSSEYFESNISGLYLFLLVCADCNVKHITFASGNNVYASNTDKPHNEDECARPEPSNIYGISKYAGELIVKDFCSTRNIGYANVRIGDIYGPNQKYGNLMKAIVNAVRNETPLKLYGDGIRTRDYIYISDVVDGLYFISKMKLYGTYNLGTGRGTSVKELIEIANQLSGGKCGIQRVDTAAEDTSHVILDVGKLEKAGFKARVDIKEGLKKTIGV